MELHKSSVDKQSLNICLFMNKLLTLKDPIYFILILVWFV